MANKYCTCGHVTQFSSAEPKFCSGCGQPFGGIISKPIIKNIAKNHQPIFLHSEETEEIIPHLEKIELVEQVRRGGPVRQETIGSIWGSDVEGVNRPKPITKKLSNKKIIEEFKKEATPRGRNNPIEFGAE